MLLKPYRETLALPGIKSLLIVATLAFSIVGILLFALAFWIIVKVSPFSVRKELEDDQNVALGIVIGAVIIGIALIVSAAVHG